MAGFGLLIVDRFVFFMLDSIVPNATNDILTDVIVYDFQ